MTELQWRIYFTISFYFLYILCNCLSTYYYNLLYNCIIYITYYYNIFKRKDMCGIVMKNEYVSIILCFFLKIIRSKIAFCEDLFFLMVKNQCRIVTTLWTLRSYNEPHGKYSFNFLKLNPFHTNTRLQINFKK